MCEIDVRLGTWSDSEISAIMLTSPTGYTTGFVRVFFKRAFCHVLKELSLFLWPTKLVIRELPLSARNKNQYRPNGVFPYKNQSSEIRF